MSSSDGRLTIALVGDMKINRPNPPSIFDATAEILRSADIRFGNCETPISDRGEPWPGKPLANNCIKMPERSLEGFTSLGFDAVGVASNHSLDFGAGALLRSLELLNGAGIQTCGGGRNVEDAHRPRIVAKNGVKVAFLGYSSVYMAGWEATEDRPGIATVRVETAYKPHPRIYEQPGSPATTLNVPDPKDTEMLVTDIRAAKSEADIVVVSWHWGVSERYRKLVPYQIELGHLALDSGADLLIGHHPHMLQSVEIYKGKPLFYSVGNFAMDSGGKNPWHDPETMIVLCRIADRRISKVSFVPCLIDGQCVPRPLKLEASGVVVRRLEEDSAQFGTRFEPDGDRITIPI